MVVVGFGLFSHNQLKRAPFYRDGVGRQIDDAVAGRAFDMHMMDELEGLSNRGYTDGFLQRHPDQDYQNYLEACSSSNRQRFVGELTSVVRNAEGEIVEGNPTEIKRQRDVWTFARDMGADDPNWQLVATGE